MDLPVKPVNDVKGIWSSAGWTSGELVHDGEGKLAHDAGKKRRYLRTSHLLT